MYSKGAEPVMQAEGRLKYLLLKTVQETGILPVTSRCNMNCKFCSNKFNPPPIEVYSPGHLSLQLVEELIDYLPPSGPVIIGESATRIIEGEPLFHPRIESILQLLRQKWSDRLIKITTNGSLLTFRMIRLLAAIQPLELNISLNCASPDERVFLMGDNNPEQVFRALADLEDNGLVFNGSLVVLPQLMDWSRIQRTIEILDNRGAKTIRVFLPGFSKYAPCQYWTGKTRKIFSKIKDRLLKLRNRYQTPLIMEPPLVEDLKPEIAGIIADTPASRAGLKTGDTILKAGDVTPVSRVHAFNIIKKQSRPELLITDGRTVQEVVVEKEGNSRSGLVMDYDLSLTVINKIIQELSTAKADNIGLITSTAAPKLLTVVLNRGRECLSGKRVQIIPVPNQFFGGTIISAGLLVNRDIIAGIEKNKTRNFDLLLLPGIIYDIYGKDLTGEEYEEISTYFSVPVRLIDQ